jgi:hypothetical protein
MDASPRLPKRLKSAVLQVGMRRTPWMFIGGDQSRIMPRRSSRVALESIAKDRELLATSAPDGAISRWSTCG